MNVLHQLMPVAIGAFCAAASAHAQDAAPPSAPPTAAPTTQAAGEGQPVEGSPAGDLSLSPDGPSERSRITVAPYAWITSFSGDVTIKGTEFDATASFIDILEETDRVFGLMGAVDIEHNRLVFQFNAAWTTAEISKTSAATDNGELRGDLDLDTALIEFFGGYRFFERAIGDDAGKERRLTIDGFVGGRVTVVDIDVDVTALAPTTLPDGSTLNTGETIEQGDSQVWFEPFVGARLGLDLSERWSLSLRGDIGGFGVSGSDLSWQTAALIGYRWEMDGWDLSLFGGYRALGQDYSDGDFDWSLITHGPLVGAQLSFSF